MKRLAPIAALLGIVCLAASLLLPADAQQGSVTAWIADRVTGLRAVVMNSTPAGTEGGLVVRCIGCTGGGPGGGTSSNYAAAFPAAGTAAGFSDGTNMQAARVFDTDTGAGVSYVLGANIRLPGAGGSTDVSVTAPFPVRFSDGTSFITPSAVGTDSGTLAGGGTGIGYSLGLNHYWDGANWVRSTPAAFGIGIEDVAETAGGALMMAGTVRRDAAASSAGATGENATLNTDGLGQVWVRHLDPCNGILKIAVPFSISTATTTQLVAADASNRIFVCSFHAITAAANNVALVEDDTAACASPTAGMAGGTTAASGWNLAANGGVVLGSGNGTMAKTALTNRYVCLITSATTQLSGTLMYAVAP